MRALADKTIEVLDTFWSSRISCAPSDFDSEGISVVARQATDGSEYAQVFRRNKRLHVSCSASLTDVLPEATRGQSREVVFDPGFFQRALDARLGCVIGPAYLGYLDTVPLGPDDTGVSLLPIGDSDSLDDLRREVSVQDWEYGGLAPGQPMAGRFVDGRLVSAAGYELWAGQIAHIGVVTRAEVRANGFGRGCVQAIARHALTLGLVAQYRTLYDNSPAMAIARDLGFIEYGATIYVVPSAT